MTASAEGPTVSGFVDFGYNYNFNKMSTNRLRTFDGNSNTFTLQNAKVALAGKTDSNVGYQVDVMYGYDATQTHSAGFITDSAGVATPNAQVDLEQAFINFECPLTHGKVTLGKFVTLHGAEVIEAKDNFNISRGLLFNYAIPFTHTGVKYDKALGPVALTGAVVNGWDNLQDNNKGKSLMGVVGYTVSPNLSLTVGGMHGPEQATATPSIEKNGRSLVDSLVKFTAGKLTLIANHDWGVEEFLGPVPAGETMNWQGLGLHGNLAFNDTCSAAVRWETLDDEGSRTNPTTLNPAVTDGQVLHSITGTLQHKMNGVIYRLEYRQDTSSKKVFLEDDGSFTDTQSTVGAQVIFAF
jgi:hypothetical protein